MNAQNFLNIFYESIHDERIWQIQNGNCEMPVTEIYAKEKQIENVFSNGDLESEEAIMNDKERFGRVRTILMKQLRAKYGEDIANRALYRINKRISEGSLRVKANLSTINPSESEI